MTKKRKDKDIPYWERKLERPARKREKPESRPSRRPPESEKDRKRGHPDRPDADEPVRLNRFIAQAGICSRREADVLIAAGKIKINGKIVKEMGAKVVPSRDRVEYRGMLLQAENFVYILYNKPKNTITTAKDPLGRPTVIEAVEAATQERVYPVGRLDRNTTGLLLLTNDGDLAKKLTHPSHNVRKLYHVRLDREVDPEDMGRLLTGIQLEDGPIQADKVDYVVGKPQNEVGIQIHSGRNRVVRRMFESLGYKVATLDRVMIAHLTKKSLPRGKWRALTTKEIGFLKMM